MIVAFLDLLGFSQLVEKNIQTADDCLYTFNRILKTKYLDANKCKETDDFFVNSSITSFKDLISISDSLIISANERDVSTFVKQLSTFVSTVAISTLKPFKQEFSDIKKVKNTDIVDVDFGGNYLDHNAFPVLFRGGISCGNEVAFFPQFYIFNYEILNQSINVVGENYVEAYKLERSGKGPRLFCNRKIVDLCTDDTKFVFRSTSDANTYEIVWTYYSCETLEMMVNGFNHNIDNAIDKIALPLYNLIKYYFQNNSEELAHYNEFLRVFLEGIALYAKKNNANKTPVICRLKNIFKDFSFIDIEDYFNN